MNEYLFVSERLGFRNWKLSDAEEFQKMNTDSEVMKYFPSIYKEGQSLTLIKKLMSQYERYGYCYFAVELLSNKEFIGFIGLAYQTYESKFTPCTDIGWRLKKEFWGQGLATEGAKRCLIHAFEELNLNKLYSIASVINEPSINVMKKIGMTRLYRFDHPELDSNERLKSCYLYEIKSEGVND